MSLSDAFETFLIAAALGCLIYRIWRGKWITMTEWYLLFSVGMPVGVFAVSGLTMLGDPDGPYSNLEIDLFVVGMMIVFAIMGLVWGRECDRAYWLAHLAEERAEERRMARRRMPRESEKQIVFLLGLEKISWPRRMALAVIEAKQVVLRGLSRR